MPTSVEPTAASAWPRLPIAITRGMAVYEISETDRGEVVGLTEAYCLYRSSQSRHLSVASWRELAVGGLCPAPVLLPDDAGERDRQNASAAAVRELLLLGQLKPLSEAQQAALEELLGTIGAS